MATFVMQSLGCEVAALNTVHFSKHLWFFIFAPPMFLRNLGALVAP